MDGVGQTEAERGVDSGRYPHYRVCNQWLMDEQAPQINLIGPDRRKESYLCTHISTELYLWLANSGLHSNLNTYPIPGTYRRHGMARKRIVA